MNFIINRRVSEKKNVKKSSATLDNNIVVI